MKTAEEARAAYLKSYTSTDGRFVHRLKCWADNFDAIVAGKKRADVRVEDADRRFKAGDRLELTRTDVAGVATSPATYVLVDVTHVDRFAGHLAIMTANVAGPVPYLAEPMQTAAVLSLGAVAGFFVEQLDGQAVSK